MRGTRRSGEDGMVTVEAAIGMAALIAVLALAAGALGVVGTQADLCQAVREGARAAATGMSAQSAVAHSMPSAFGVAEAAEGNWVTVAASAPALEFGVLTCSATTLIEPGALR